MLVALGTVLVAISSPETYCWKSGVIEYCAEVMQTYISNICGFSWFSNEKNIKFRWKRIFDEKSQ